MNLVGRSTGRLLRRLLIGLIGVVAVVGTTAGPSNAAPYWQTYHKTPSWHCGSPDNLFVGNGFFEVQACVVRSGAYVQAVMTITSKVSADGKTRTSTFKGKDAQGRAVNNSVVYDKQ